MSETLRSQAVFFEETVPEHFVAYVPNSKNKKRFVAHMGTVEKRCGKWLWWMADESDIGLCDEKEAAKKCVIKRIEAKNERNKGGTLAGFVPPTIEDVKSYCDKWCHSNRYNPDSINAEMFFACGEANGWMTSNGKKPLKDWKPSLIAWIKREGEKI